MAKRDPERTHKIRVAVRYLLDHGCLHKGNQTRLAEHFQVSRQRVHQIVVEERRRDAYAATQRPASHVLDGVSGFSHHIRSV
jgi:hypothetical protein